MEELLEVYDQNLKKLGVQPRSIVHKEGLLHAVSHLWITDIKSNQIFYQLRSMNKAQFPGYYDITCAGHIDPKETPTDAILRETQEEIGLQLEKNQLTFLGTVIEHFECDHEIAYIYICDLYRPSFEVGPEVTEMLSMPLHQFMQDIPTYLLTDSKGHQRKVENTQICPHDVSLVREYIQQ